VRENTRAPRSGQPRKDVTVSYGELERLFEQFFALVEAAVRLPPGLERRIAFRDVRDYGTRIDQIATRLLKQDRR
jgi:hypothetical protein